MSVIHPYKHNGTWVFDDEHVGLVREPFVSGADTIIDRLTHDIPNADRGFSLVFSASPFPGYQAELERLREEYGGHWYRLAAHDIEGWLCPALFKYFDVAPAVIYAQFKPRAA